MLKAYKFVFHNVPWHLNTLQSNPNQSSAIHFTAKQWMFYNVFVLLPLSKGFHSTPISSDLWSKSNHLDPCHCISQSVCHRPFSSMLLNKLLSTIHSTIVSWVTLYVWTIICNLRNILDTSYLSVISPLKPKGFSAEVCWSAWYKVARFIKSCNLHPTWSSCSGACFSCSHYHCVFHSNS